MLQFGMPTLIETNALLECAMLCSELELDFIELNMNLPQYQLNRLNIPFLKETAEQHGIYYTIHLDENLNVCDFNPYIADACRRTVSETIQLAKRLEIPIINMHLPRGVHFTMPDKKIYLFAEYKEQYLKSIRDFRVMCEKAIENSNMMICVENCDGFLPFQMEAVDILLQSGVFGLTFDIGHNHSCGNLDEPYIMQNKAHLHHMHVHDAIGSKNHLALGTGELDLLHYLTLAQESQCRIVLETKTIDGLKQSVSWLQTSGIFFYKEINEYAVSSRPIKPDGNNR